jgi:hypothetical protein
MDTKPAKEKGEKNRHSSASSGYRPTHTTADLVLNDDYWLGGTWRPVVFKSLRRWRTR